MPFIDDLSGTERFLFTIFLMIAISFIFKIISLFLHKSVPNIIVYHRIKTSLGYFLFISTIIIIVFIWINNTHNISTYLGLLSAGIAFALRDIILNIVSWLLIVSKKPFTIGDRIEIGPVAGDVIDQKLFHFTLLEIRNWVNGDQSTGRIVHVPNYKVFSETLANYSKGFQYIWNEITVNMTLDSDWQKAKVLLLDIITQYSSHLSNDAGMNIHDANRKYMIYYNKLTPTVYTHVLDKHIQLSLRYLCEPRNRRNTEHEIWEKILILLKEENEVKLS